MLRSARNIAISEAIEQSSDGANMIKNAELSVDDFLNIRCVKDTDAVLFGGALLDSLTQPLNLVGVQF